MTSPQESSSAFVDSVPEFHDRSMLSVVRRLVSEMIGKCSAAGALYCSWMSDQSEYDVTFVPARIALSR